MKASDFFEFPTSIPFADFFSADAAPWEWVSQIKHALNAGFQTQVPGDIPPGVSIAGDVYIHESVKLPPFCSIQGPAWIGEGVEIRPGAFIRGNVIVGAGSVMGNSCEFKNCLLLEGAQVPHFSYVGDSVLGNKAHLGAGVILSNLRLDQKSVKVQVNGIPVDTGMRKLGSLLGDYAEVGCNSSLNPGTILGKRALVSPVSSFVGTLEAETIHVTKAPNRVVTRRD